MHNIPDFLKISSEMQNHFAKGGMIKRADGSYSRRGLWDNIRANKGSGRKPTKEMLEQEAKIKAQEQYGGHVEEYGKGGYTVKRSNARKGKTHVVIGPDGTKKYFGDSKLGQHPNDPARKKAFYARHKHNLAHNPYFRAFARATWEDGGEVPHFEDGGKNVNNVSDLFASWKKEKPVFDVNQSMQDFIMRDPSRNVQQGPEVGPVVNNYDTWQNAWERPLRGSAQSVMPGYYKDGGNYGAFYGRRDATKMQNMFTPSANSMTPSFFAMGGLNQYQSGRSIRRFNLGGDNPFENQMSSQNEFESTYSPYSVNPWATGQPQQSVAASSGNPFQNQLNTQNQAAVTGSPYNTTVPQTANSGQGINTTTPQQSPAVAATTPVQSSTPVQPAAPAQTPATAGTFNPSNNPFVTGSANSGQNTTTTSGGGLGPVNSNYNILNQNPNYPASQLPGATATTATTGLSGSEIASRNQEYEDRMIKEYGIKRKDIDKRYAELSAQYTNSTPEDIYSALNKEFGDQAKQNKQDEALKAEKTRLKTIAGGLKGASQAFDAGLAGADLLSRMNPNSSQMAVLRKNRENANPTNTMNIVGNRKGIEYAAHGGYTGLKEGTELDLTTQQIHELEKQGYKFQIL